MRILKTTHNINLGFSIINILRIFFKLLITYSILSISKLILIILTYSIKLVSFFSKGKKYLQAIMRFLLILLKKNKISFVALNILGILSKVMLIIGFIYAAKMATLIYQNKINLMLNSEQLGLMQGLISPQVAILLISAVAFLIFFSAGLFPYLYSKFIQDYSYTKSLDLRKFNAEEFLNNFAAIPDKEKRYILRQQIFNADNKYTREFMAIVLYIFEMLQSFTVLCISFAILIYLYPMYGFYFLAMLTIVILVYVNINWKFARRKKIDEKTFLEDINSEKRKLLDHKEMLSVGPFFKDSFRAIYGAVSEKKYNISIRANQVEVGKIQIALQTVLGIFFAIILYILADGQYTIDFMKLVLTFLLIRFLFGTIQSFLSALKNTNQEFDVLKNFTTRDI
jgi:hypothetical protein